MDSTKNCSAAEKACSTSGFNQLHAPKKMLQTSEVPDGKRSVDHEEKDGRKKFKTLDKSDNLALPIHSSADFVSTNDPDAEEREQTALPQSSKAKMTSDKPCPKPGEEGFKDEMDILFKCIGGTISPNLDQGVLESMLFKSPNMKKMFDSYMNISERIFMTMFLENSMKQSSRLPKSFIILERQIEEKTKKLNELNKKNEELKLEIKNCQEEFKKKEDVLNVLEARNLVLYREYLKKLLEKKDNLLKKKTEEANLLRMSGEQIKKKIMEAKKIKRI